MKTIWKWQLPPIKTTTIHVPLGAEVLAVQEQHGIPCVWVLVDPDAATEKRTFSVYGTGHAIPEQHGSYVGTVQMMGGSLVFHVFENDNITGGA